MRPDGSQRRTQGGEGIPNIDSVKSTIRTYYDATDGIAEQDDLAVHHRDATSRDQVGRRA